MLRDFFVERLRDFWCGEVAYFFLRLCDFFVKRLGDFLCGKVA